MHFFSNLLVSLCWVWMFSMIILGEENSELTKKCKYYGLSMHMDCNNVNFGEIQPNTYPVNVSEIQDLLLHHNGLRKLEYNVFYNLPKLLSLDLSDNFLSSLDYRLFMKNPQLETLSLRNNKLNILNDHRLFEFQNKLTYIYLDFNRLKYLNVSVLKPLVSLNSLYLYGNSLVCNCELKKTMLWCVSKGIETNAVCESPVSYANTSWTILNKEDCNKTENTTKLTILDSRCNYDIQTRSLNCTDVPLRTINAKHFQTNLTLNSLILYNTSLSVLEYNVFNALSSLNLLDLSNNFLENLDQHTFSKLDQLKTLELSHNKIVSVSGNLFKMQKQLKVLKLNNNHLSHLAKETLTPLVSLEHLYLSENRFVCDCDLSDAMFWCEEQNISTGATCAYPRQLSGFTWTVLQNNTLCIKSTTQNYVTMSPIESNPTNFNIILLVVIITTGVLFLLSVLGALWYVCKRRRRDEDIYDDICLEEIKQNNYEVLDDKRDIHYENGTINKQKNLSKSSESDLKNTAVENTYEDIEFLRSKNKPSTSQEHPKNVLDSNGGKSEKKDNRNVASYMDMSGSTNRTRKENPYILK